MPLAIELAAALITILSPQELLERMDRRFELLRSPRTGDHRSRLALDETTYLTQAVDH